LIVPPNPLTAAGLATPYVLSGNCTMTNSNEQAFVQGAIISRSTGEVYVYNPLVITEGTTPLVPPVYPTLPPDFVVGIWFGFNGNILTLVDNNNNRTLNAAKCVNGGGPGDTPFSQFAYCNAVEFFQVANEVIAKGLLSVAELGFSLNGHPCPTVRSFAIVDQDQSDNVDTTYLISPSGQTYQNSALNAAIPGGTVLANPSDNALTALVDAALGCTPWKVPDLSNCSYPTASLPMDELLAAYRQPAPVALVPGSDPMTIVPFGGTTQSLVKTSVYRRGVNQDPVNKLCSINGVQYCVDLLNIAPSQLVADSYLTLAAPTPLAGSSSNLFTFLAMRLDASVGNLNCPGLLNVTLPFLLTTDPSTGEVLTATLDPNFVSSFQDFTRRCGAYPCSGDTDHETQARIAAGCPPCCAPTA